MPRINVRLLVEDRGLLSLHPIDTNGKPAADPICRSIDWPEHFAVVEPFTVLGPRLGGPVVAVPHVLFLRPGKGDIHIHEVADDGALGTVKHRHNWPSGWTSITFYRIGDLTFCLRLQEDTGAIEVLRMTAKGDFDEQRVAAQTVSRGWTQVRSFEAGGQPYLFMLKRTNGTVRVWRIITNSTQGTVGDLDMTARPPVPVYEDNWSSGWTHARIYRAGGDTFLFLLKSQTGLVHLHRMRPDGRVGARIDTLQWSHQEVGPGGLPQGANWTNVQFYERGGRTYCYLLKEGDGRAHVHEVRNDGTIVADPIYNRELSTGWTAARTYATASGLFLLLQKDLGARPLRRTFVEHVAGPVVLGLYCTDDDGHLRDERGDRGVDNPIGDRIDLRVICQNAVVRQFNGPVDHWRDFTGVTDDRTITIREGSDQHERFRVLNRHAEVYDWIFRPLEVFDNRPFPLHASGTLRQRRDGARRIGLLFPDPTPQAMSYVEPIGLTNEFPIIHLEGQNDDARLWGGNGRLPTLIPGELSHALHFSMLTADQRRTVLRDYVGFILGDGLSGGGGTHDTDKETTPMVAFLEALDLFTGRFATFIRHTPGRSLDNTFFLAFVENELRSAKLVGELPDAADLRTGSVSPKLRGGSIEGAIYGALYLDWARRQGVGINRVVSDVIASRALTVGEFVTWVHANRGAGLRESLNEVIDRWEL